MENDGRDEREFAPHSHAKGHIPGKGIAQTDNNHFVPTPKSPTGWCYTEDMQQVL